MVTVRAEWEKLATKGDLVDGRVVVKNAAGTKILLQEYKGKIYAIANNCSHLGLPLQGKILKGEVNDGCIVCPAHGTNFDLKTGAVVGEWCPKLPNLPVVGKGPKEKPQPVFECRTKGEDIEVMC
ncbi:unnamed protein product [Pedinophyceae sp. YPF-701]|nr:unnamed protein product [Pedinophyceae sp. YPF-701]